jgi:glycosyltransferase involved in cell wall biosynthesis
MLNALSLSRLSGIEVVVSDNSGDPTKHDAWARLSDESFRYMKSPHAGASKNGDFAFKATSGEWVCFLSDDDQLIALHGFDANKWEPGPSTAGICPAMALYSETQGIYRISNMLLDQPKAIQRVQHYFNNHGGANTTLFSCFKREISEGLNECIAKHPTRGGYNDWAIVLALISSGPMAFEPNLLYIYNNRNWSTNEDINRNTGRTFTDVGMAEDNSEILFAHLALDSVSFICRSTSPVEVKERLEAGQFALESYFTAFSSVVQSNDFSVKVASDRVPSCRYFVGWASSVPEKIASLIVIIDLWNPGLGEKYVRFMLDTVEPMISSFLLSKLSEASKNT